METNSDYRSQSEDEIDSECVPEGMAHPMAGGAPHQHTDMSRNGQSEWFSSAMSETLYSAANRMRIPGPTRMAVTNVYDLMSLFF